MTNSFNLFTVGLIAIVCIIAVILTYRVLREEEQKQKELREQNDSAKDELERSLEYEKNSWRTNISGLTWIYIITTVIILVGFFIYLF